MEKLVAREFAVEEDSTYPEVGEKYSYFVDPETGKHYRPAEGFEVTGKDLSDRFIEVPS